MPAVPPEAAVRLRLRVNPIRCTAFGFCAEYAPELFDLDEWGYAMLRADVIAPERAALAREASRLCPTQAILLERRADRAGAARDTTGERGRAT